MIFGLLLNLHFNPRQKNLRFFSDIIFTKPLVRSKKILTPSPLSLPFTSTLVCPGREPWVRFHYCFISFAFRFVYTCCQRRTIWPGYCIDGGKQAQFGLGLPDFSPGYPVKTVLFRKVKINALISPCLPKYGRIGLEKRGAPRPFKSRLVFPGGLPVWGEICPGKGRYRGRFSGGLKNGENLLRFKFFLPFE